MAEVRWKLPQGAPSDRNSHWEIFLQGAAPKLWKYSERLLKNQETFLEPYCESADLQIIARIWSQAY